MDTRDDPRDAEQSFFDEMQRAVASADPVRSWVVDAGRAAFWARDLDAELANLTYDSLREDLDWQGSQVALSLACSASRATKSTWTFRSSATETSGSSLVRSRPSSPPKCKSFTPEVRRWSTLTCMAASVSNGSAPAP